MWLSIFAVLYLGVLPSVREREERGALIIHIENIQETGGVIHVALYDDPERFPNDSGMLYGEVIEATSSDDVELVIPELAYGIYAVAIYHDLNNNGKLDKNLLGIPTEPYAFSKKEPSKWRSPAFDEVSFTMDSPRKRLTLPLEVWKNR